MTRRSYSKVALLVARHPGLGIKMGAMFDELWNVKDVQRVIAEQFGEQVSTATLARYRRRHWQGRQEPSEAREGESERRPNRAARQAET